MLDKFHTEFPNEEACLAYLVKKRWPRKKLYPVHFRKCYADKYGKQYFPLKGTIFQGSRTPLMKWFFAIYLFSVSKNGVSAAELRRHLGVTEKCAWRMGSQIRKLMKDTGPKLSGVVEADETYIGTRRSGRQMVLLGAAQRGGKIRVKATPNRREETVIPFLVKNVRKGSRLMTDEAYVYQTTKDYKHKYVTHSKYQWVRGSVHTNNLEGFWSHFKRSIRGTYHGVSKRHLQSYCDQQTFLWNHRGNVFEALVERL